MSTYLIGYSIIGFLLLFVLFSILVKKKVLFAHTPSMQKIFAHPLLHYSIRRIGSALISLTLAVTVTFFLIRAAQPADQTCVLKFADNKTSPELLKLQCENWKIEMGLAGHWTTQLLNFYYSILPFPKTLCMTTLEPETMRFIVSDCRTFIVDFGKVYGTGGQGGYKYVIDDMLPRMSLSFQVGIIAIVLQLALGYPLGILMAKYKDRLIDKIGLGYIISIDAIPGVAYYYIWMALFTQLLNLPRTFKPEVPASWLPPILTMAFTGMAGIALWVRRFMVDEFNSDYVKFARAKGLSENRILFTHILRNAIVPLVRSIPSAVLSAMMGTYYLEHIYGIQGMGASLMTANETKNAPMIQAIVIVSAILSIFSYLLGDIVTAMVDPRVSFTSGD